MAPKENTTLSVVYNAKIYISGKPDLSWMLFNTQTGYILDVGACNPPLSRVAPERQVDCGGRRVLPGLHEAHIHVSSTGRAVDILDLENCSSIEDFQQRIKNYASKNPDRSWIHGRKWEQDIMGRWPTKEDVDAVCADRPAVLVRACGHVMVLNSKALEVVGFTKDTPNPEGGSLDHYSEGHPQCGELTGIIRETAKRAVYESMEMTTEDKVRYITKGCQRLLECGVTSNQSCEGPFWKEYCLLADQDRLPVRTFFSAVFHGRDEENFPEVGETRGRFLSCDRIKLWADGSLGAATAAISMPYKNSDDKGLLTHTQDNLNQLVHEANSAGFRLEIHVIGDAAADAALDAMEYARVAPEKRPILTHCQILHDDIIDRMKAQGCVANIQPQFVPTDVRWAGDLLPDELMTHAYVWKTLLNRGIVCAGGSDAPVESPEPLKGIYDAVFRPVGERTPGRHPVFKPEECVSMQEAIDMYTIGAAYATFQEHRLGQLLPGFQADFTVIEAEADVVENPEALLTAKVQQTWVAGQRKF